MDNVYKTELSFGSVHKWACGHAYLRMLQPDFDSPPTVTNTFSITNSIIPDYDMGDQIIKFSVIFSKMILDKNHVLNPITGKIT